VASIELCDNGFHGIKNPVDLIPHRDGLGAVVVLVRTTPHGASRRGPVSRANKRLGLRGLARCAGRRKGSRHLIDFLVDSSAVWRLPRQPERAEAWNGPLLS